MKIAVRYHTRSGNTQKLAEAIAADLSVTAEDLSSPLVEETDLLFLGSSVYAAGVDEAVIRFLRENKDQIKKLIFFSTAAILSSTYKQVQKLCKELNIPIDEREYHCRGSFLMMHKGRPNANDCENAAEFAKNIVKLSSK